MAKLVASYMTTTLLVIDGNSSVLYSGKRKVASFDDVYTGLDAMRALIVQVRKAAMKVWDEKHFIKQPEIRDGYMEGLV